MIKAILIILALIAAAFFAAPEIQLLRTPIIPLDDLDRIIESGLVDKAIPLCKKRLRANPEEAETAYRLGELYEEKKDYKNAAKLYQGLIDKRSDDALANYYRGRLYYKEGKFESAAKYLTYAESLFAEMPGQGAKELIKLTLGVLSQIYLDDLKAYDKAVDALEKFVPLDPGHWQAQYQLGVAYAYSGSWENADKQFSQIMEKNPGTELAKHAERAIQSVREKRNPERSDKILVYRG